MSYWSTELAPFPLRSQHTTLTIDGQPSENTDLDCGPTVTAITLEWLTGVRIYPDTIKDWMLGQGYVGPTDATHIQNFLAQFCATHTTALSPAGVTGPGSLTNLIWQYTVKGKPLLCLKQYSATVASLHWVAVCGIDPTLVIWSDPWDATRRTTSYADFASLYRSALLGVERLRDPNL